MKLSAALSACTAAALSLVMGVVASPVAQAAPHESISATQKPGALAAPGAPIRAIIKGGDLKIPASWGTVVIPREMNTAACSQGPTGRLRLNTGEVRTIMVTAGHCASSVEDGVEQYEPVTYVNTHSGGMQRIGTPDHMGAEIDTDLPFPVFIRHVADSTDWATVRLDPGVPTSRTTYSRDHYGAKRSRPVALTGIKDFSYLRRGDVSFDVTGQPICKDGYRTARSCGVQLARTQNSVYTWGLNYKQGDSGGINYNPRTREAVGVTSLGLGPLGRAQTIDRAIETGYGIRSGQVNQRFKLAQSTQGQADFKSFADEDRDFNATLARQGAQLPAPTYPQANWVKAQAEAQRAAATTAHELTTAPPRNAAELEQAAQDTAATFEHHRRELIKAGTAKIMDDFLG